MASLRCSLKDALRESLMGINFWRPNVQRCNERILEPSLCGYRGRPGVGLRAR
jgi:hypothetical protein